MLTQLEYANKYLTLIKNLINKVDINDLAEIISALETAHKEKRQVFIAGNGGSAATAGHMANDLMIGVAKNQRYGLRTIALADHIAPVTALANDISYAEIFSGQIKHLADPGDFLVVISVSGNSPNIINALEEAAKIGMYTVAFLGMDGGKAAAMVDKSVIVPSHDYGPVEDLHMIFDHLITGYFQQ